MSTLDEIKDRLNKMSVIMERFLEGKKDQEQVGNVATPVEGIPVDDPAVFNLYKGFTKYLQDEGFISKKPLDKRDTDKGNAALTPDETPASVKGPVTVLYGLRKLKEKIADANFVVENLPATTEQPQGGVANTTWTVNDVATIRTQYGNLSEVVKELKSLMSSLTLSI